jgi:hypothetical protein
VGLVFQQGEWVLRPFQAGEPIIDPMEIKSIRVNAYVKVRPRPAPWAARHRRPRLGSLGLERGHRRRCLGKASCFSPLFFFFPP